MNNYNRICGINENLLYNENENENLKLKKQIKNRKRKSQLEFREVLDKEMKKDEW